LGLSPLPAASLQPLLETLLSLQSQLEPERLRA
jgi:hypothetical protein